MKRMGKQTWVYTNPVHIQSAGTTVGPKEANGPLREDFDSSYDKLRCGESSWELAERKLLMDAITICLEKKNRKPEEIDFLLAGDLLNQLVTSNYTALATKIPFLGMFSACATSMETLAMASVLIDGGYAEQVIAATSSHQCTAERQFRYPTEFGFQRKEESTYTVTGAGSVLVSSAPSLIRVMEATIGRVIQLGITDPYDLGSAMAPAAADTILTHLKETKRTPADYDCIITGDLSRVGSGILRKLLEEEGCDLRDKHDDCGVMIYNPDQGTFAGGSGAACSAVVTYGHLLKEMERGQIERMLVVATGALMNPVMLFQQEPIPCIAHAVSFQREV